MRLLFCLDKHKFILMALTFMSAIFSIFSINNCNNSNQEHSFSPAFSTWLFDNSPKIKLLEIENRFKQRSEHLANYCKGRPKVSKPEVKLSRNYSVHEHFLYKEANVYFCSPPKTGSTALDILLIEQFIYPFGMDRILNIRTNKTLSRETVRNMVHHRHRFQFDNFTQVNQLKHQLKFLVIRNPVDRLWSCWYDKLSGTNDPNGTVNAVAKAWAPTIAEIGKNSENTIVGNDTMVKWPTFEQFLDFIGSNFTETITFNQTFSTWERQRTYNHWKPIYDQCFPCDIE